MTKKGPVDLGSKYLPPQPKLQDRLNYEKVRTFRFPRSDRFWRREVKTAMRE